MVSGTCRQGQQCLFHTFTAAAWPCTRQLNSLQHYTAGRSEAQCSRMHELWTIKPNISVCIGISASAILLIQASCTQPVIEAFLKTDSDKLLKTALGAVLTSTPLTRPHRAKCSSKSCEVVAVPMLFTCSLQPVGPSMPLCTGTLLLRLRDLDLSVLL